MTAKLNLNDYDRDPVQAIQEFWMNAADEGRDVGLDEIVEAVVDGQCARGDYEGCSPELEAAFEAAQGYARRALGVAV